MDDKDVEGFKRECRAYLSKANVNILRSYGRTLQLRKPTTMVKHDLIEEIIGVLCGKIKTERNGKKGAPIKGECVTQDFLDEIAAMQQRYLLEESLEAEEATTPKPPESLTMQCTVQFSQLSAEQKQLFISFLSSL